MGATQGRVYAVVFCKEQNDTKCKNFVDLLCSYVNTFILLYFLRFQEGGATAPLAPPKSATENVNILLYYHI